MLFPDKFNGKHQLSQTVVAAYITVLTGDQSRSRLVRQLRDSRRVRQ